MGRRWARRLSKSEKSVTPGGLRLESEECVPPSLITSGELRRGVPDVLDAAVLGVLSLDFAAVPRFELRGGGGDTLRDPGSTASYSSCKLGELRCRCTARCVGGLNWKEPPLMPDLQLPPHAGR